MTKKPIDAKSGLFARLNLWAQERFDGAAVFSSVLLYFLIAIPARVAIGSDHLLAWTDVVGTLCLISFFLLLRIFDEHKDYSEDLVLHPQRVLSRGIVRLAELRNLGILCLVLQVVASFSRGLMTGMFYSACLIWGLLMLKEFFVREWLKKKAFLYVLTHMFVATLTAFWIMAFVGVEAPQIWILWPLSLIPFVMGFLYELSRKSFGLDEDPRLESYPQVFGKKKLILLLMILGVISALLVSRVLEMIGFTSWSLIFLCFYLLVLAGWRKYFQHPLLKTRKLSQGTTGLAILLIYSFVIFYSWFQYDKSV